MPGLSISLPAREDQTAFNLSRWEEVLADPRLARLEERIETDRHGRILTSPPPANPHSFAQSEIHYLLRTPGEGGTAQVEAPLSTSDGIRAADVVWCSADRFREIYDRRAFIAAPDICVEVLSPSNSVGEIQEKIALYFEVRAREVWLCEADGTLRFHRADGSGAAEGSGLIPAFPGLIEIPD